MIGCLYSTKVKYDSIYSRLRLHAGQQVNGFQEGNCCLRIYNSLVTFMICTYCGGNCGVAGHFQSASKSSCIKSAQFMIRALRSLHVKLTLIFFQFNTTNRFVLFQSHLIKIKSRHVDFIIKEIIIVITLIL